jgi:hypothetical protein
MTDFLLRMLIGNKIFVIQNLKANADFYFQSKRLYLNNIASPLPRPSAGAFNPMGKC